MNYSNLLSCLLLIIIGFSLNSIEHVTGLSTDKFNKTSCNNFKLNNGRMRMKPKGKLAKFQCNKGFILVGTKYSYCSKGQFDVEPPFCAKASCKNITRTLTNGFFFSSYNGSVKTLFCSPGFQINGADTIYCDGTNWINNQSPTCIASNSSTIPLFCDFETDDLCGWSHDLNHDFDWKRHNLNTSSSDRLTGPKFDHTKGPNQNGYYMYIESSTRVENETARLISPVFPKMNKTLCFTFYYHMFGKDTGMLRVYFKKESDDFEKLTPEFVLNGEQGNVWNAGQIFLKNGINEDFQIIIEAVRGASFMSDIAVDDVELSETCPKNSGTTIEVNSTEDYNEFILESSCGNRCGTSGGICDCTDLCFERNSCCPDYLPQCYKDSSNDFFEETRSTNLETSTISLEKLTFTPTSTIFISPTTTTTAPIASRTTTTTAPIASRTTTTAPIASSTTTAPIASSTTTTTAPIASSTTTTKRIEEPTTIKQYFKLTTTPKQLNKKLETNDIISKIKWKFPRRYETTVKPSSPEEPEDPELHENSEEFDETPTENPFTLMIETDFESSTKTKPTVQFLQQNVKKPLPKLPENNLTLLYIEVIVSSAIIICSFTIVIVMLRKSHLSCSKFKFKNSRNTESMSDVRFLTSDEILDFTPRS